LDLALPTVENQVVSVPFLIDKGSEISLLDLRSVRMLGAKIDASKKKKLFPLTTVSIFYVELRADAVVNTMVQDCLPGKRRSLTKHMSAVARLRIPRL
jgi:hypothetical protein